MTTTSIIGPDPAALDDAELLAAALMLAAIGQELAGTPGEAVPRSIVAELDPAPRFAFEAVETLWRLLLAENDRRLQDDDADVLAGFEVLLSKRAGEP